jgi:hypothetical protein
MKNEYADCLSEELKGRFQLGVLGEHERIILKWILKK